MWWIQKCRADGFMGTAGGVYQTKWVPWSPVQVDPQNYISRDDIAGDISGGGIKFGPSLAVHGSVG